MKLKINTLYTLKLQNLKSIHIVQSINYPNSITKHFSDHYKAYNDLKITKLCSTRSRQRLHPKPSLQARALLRQNNKKFKKKTHTQTNTSYPNKNNIPSNNKRFLHTKKKVASLFNYIRKRHDGQHQSEHQAQ